MSNKPFKTGIVVGRFQTFHKGHEFIIDKAVELCENVGILIGSSQESGTLKNPFTYETRERILKTIYGNSVEVRPLPDIGVGNNSKWGEYVLESYNREFKAFPDLLVSGKEDRRIDWFDGAVGITVAELYVPKTIDISATKMREFFINGTVEEWKSYTNEKLWEDYEKLRAEVLAAKDNLATASL